MTKCKKWLQTILPILFLLLSLLPIKETFAAETDPVYDKIIQKGELVVGLSADYAPYEFHAKVDGEDKIVGFDISIAQKIADDLGVKLKIEELGFDALLGALKTGKIDMVISGMSPTPERLKEVAFSQPYMNVQQRVIVRKEDKDKFHSTKDFEGVRAGAQKQTTQEELIKTELTGAVPTSLQKIPDLIMNLKNNKLDAVVMEEPVGEAYVSQNEDLAFADVTFEKGSKDTAVAFPKDAPVLTEKVNASIKPINDQ
ncbi:MAG: transporter substrate-binding domain-containing protein, partial [Enterococcus sp.]|nr:transporter substrate-binding domain-containing protein [Enterococcus sp.]